LGASSVRPICSYMCWTASSPTAAEAEAEAVVAAAVELLRARSSLATRARSIEESRSILSSGRGGSEG
jgi:F420-dependent methylenetetrahydromethanopterin dehydrogenase